jgi:hypothetical protein
MVRIDDRLLITPAYIIAVEVDPVSGFYLTLNGKKIVRTAAAGLVPDGNAAGTSHAPSLRLILAGCPADDLTGSANL